MACGVGAALPPHIDVEAIEVQRYAAEHPNENKNHTVEAGKDGVLVFPLHVSQPTLADETPIASASDPESAAHGQKRHDEDAVDEEPSKKTRFADTGF